MTPKEKAKELFDRFTGLARPEFGEYAIKKLSTMCCEEIIKSFNDIESNDDCIVMESINDEEDYWLKVSYEIEKL